MDLWSEFLGHAGPFLYWTVIAGTIAAQSLIAVWAAASSRPRAIRIMVALAAIGLLMPIGAHWPAMVFLQNGTVAFAIISIWRQWQARHAPEAPGSRTHWHFQLADLFILVLYLSVVLALSRHLGLVSSWTVVFLPLLGLTLGPIIALAYLAAAGPGRRGMVVATLVAICTSALLLLRMNVAQAMHIPILIRMSAFRNDDQAITVALVSGTVLINLSVAVWCAVLLWTKGTPQRQRMLYAIAMAVTTTIGVLVAAVAVEGLRLDAVTTIRKYILLWLTTTIPLFALAALVAGATWIARTAWENYPARWRWLRVASIAIATIALIPAGWIYLQLLWPTPFPPPPASDTNHYDRIVAIARQLREADRGTSHAQLGPKQIKLLAEAKELLSAANYIPTAALEMESQRRMPHDGLNGDDVQTLYGHLFVRTESAGERKEYDLGADYAIAAIRFDTLLHRGGTAAHGMVIRPHRSLQWLALSRDVISPPKARELIREIERALGERESLATLEERSWIQGYRSDGWRGQLNRILSDPRRRSLTYSDNYAWSELSLRSLQVLFALRLFHDEHGRLPAQLSELVPTYLAKVPLDPYSHQPLAYRALDVAEFRLYSVGPDRIDNGGAFDTALARKPSGFDWDLSWSGRGGR